MEWMVALVVLCGAGTALAQRAAAPNLSLTLPRGWQATQTAEGASLLPPSATDDEQYELAVTEGAAGVTLDDPQVAQAVVDRIVEKFSAMELARQPEMCNVAGLSGVRMFFVGTNQTTAQRVLVGVWITMGQGKTIVFTAAGPYRTVLARVDGMDEIATACRLTAARSSAAPRRATRGQAPSASVDPSLVGAWQYTKSSSYVSPSYGGDSFSMATATTVTLYMNADGTGVLNVRSEMAGGTGSVGYDSGRDAGNNTPFTWSAQSGVVTVQSENGTSQYRYQVQGNTLIANNPDGTRTAYQRVR
jgi:hypothetical protein